MVSQHWRYQHDGNTHLIWFSRTWSTGTAFCWTSSVLFSFETSSGYSRCMLANFGGFSSWFISISRNREENNVREQGDGVLVSVYIAQDRPRYMLVLPRLQETHLSDFVHPIEDEARSGNSVSLSPATITLQRYRSMYVEGLPGEPYTAGI